jgi:inner membrane protein involved in colicin E2 resistance
MNDLSLQSSLRMKSRSMGVKLIVVCGLALLMAISALFVGSLVEERTQRAADVIREISSHVGGHVRLDAAPGLGAQQMSPEASTGGV